MTVTYVTTRHRCEFCRRSYAHRSDARKHEAACFRNPAARGCPTCAHFASGKSWFLDCQLGIAKWHESGRAGEDSRMEWERDCSSWAVKS